MMRQSGLRLRVAANLAAAVSLCFGLLAFTTMSVLRRSVRDADLLAVTQGADLLAFQLSRCADEHCVSASVSEARRLGLMVTFHDRPIAEEKPRWVAAAPEWEAHVSVERRVGTHVIAVQMPLTTMAQRSQSEMTALVLSLVFNGLALIIIGTLLFERNVVRRLALVDEQLGSIERLDLETPLWTSEGGDEIGRMSGTLRRITEKLRDDKRRTKAYIDELQQTNKTLREAQEGLARNERLATVGRLAAGVAHEIGNPIAAILGYVEILRIGAAPKEYVSRMKSETRSLRSSATSRSCGSAPHRRSMPTGSNARRVGSIESCGTCSTSLGRSRSQSVP
jgi:signal transduction histidine kinase